MRAKHILPILLLVATPLAAQVNVTSGEWRRLGPDGGTLTDLVAAPSDPMVLYASAQGEFYRSGDGGASWVSTADNRLTFKLAVDAADPSLVYAVQDDGPVRSRDGGLTWERIDVPGGAVRQFVAHPRFARTVYAVTEGGLYRSPDAGRSWKGIRRGFPSMYSADLLVIDPVAPRWLYVGVEEAGMSERSLLRSRDGGISWQPIDHGPLAGRPVLALATHPRSASILYASIPEGVFKSVDGGRSWKSAGPGASAGIVHILAVHPARPDVVYAGADGGLFRSLNGGASWVRLTQGLPDPVSVTLLLASRRTLLAAAIASGRRGGVFRSSDAGSSWTFSSRGIHGMDVKTVDFGAPGTLWVVADFVLFRSTDSGLTWIRIRPDPAAVVPPTALAVDPTNRSNAFVLGSDGTVWRSADAGRTWETAGNAGLQALGLTIDPQTPSTLYAAGIGGSAGIGGIAKSVDRGDTWTLLPVQPATYYEVDIAPSSPSTLYATATLEDFTPLLLRSDDGGASWTQLRFDSQGAIYPSLAVDPLVATTVYTSDQGYIYKSTDGGQTWSQVSNPVDSNTTYPLAISDSGRLYAAVWDIGVVAYEDGNPTGEILGRLFPWGFNAVAPDPHDPCRVYVAPQSRSLLVFTHTGIAGCPGS